MTTLLLDTNILVPLLSRQSQSLPPAVLAAAIEPSHTQVASAVSLWEIAIKMRIGKLHLDCKVSDLPRLTRDLGAIELGISYEHAVAAVAPEPETRDPFDRLLLAQCAVENMRLLTVDRILAAHPYAWR